VITQADQTYDYGEKQDDVGDECDNDVKLVIIGVEHDAKSLARAPNRAELQMDEPRRQRQ
jgi:hypothetical protein